VADLVIVLPGGQENILSSNKNGVYFMKLPLIAVLSMMILSCQKKFDAPVPDWQNWEQFYSPNALPLTRTTFQAMEGVYDLTSATDFFGDQAVVKSSFAITNHDTLWHVSFFFGKDISYFIGEGRQLNGDILLNGYWRKMTNTETGIARCTIKAADGASILLGTNPVPAAGAVKIKGVFGNEGEEPADSISLVYNRRLNQSTTFQVLAHRGGGRTSDLLPVSENSVEMIKKTVEFGSTGVEIDVRLTRDDSLILYHDKNINLREVQKSGLVGPIENFSYAELSNFVTLIKGEKIPTLRQALDAIVYETPLTTVYLDTKIASPLQQLRDIQVEYEAKAAAAGRKVEILIGLPTQDQLDQFLLLPNYTTIPSLCELTVEDVRMINSTVWAPRWTLGTQNEKVAEMHAEGRRVFVWTMDVPAYIDQFLDEGQLDGILTNYPSYVAYAHYKRP
jgi:glycerophosphoryl diester phosphodiesterase